MSCVCGGCGFYQVQGCDLTLDLLDGLLGIGLDVLNGALEASLLIGLVLCDSGDLDEADHSEEEVDGGEAGCVLVVGECDRGAGASYR